MFSEDKVAKPSSIYTLRWRHCDIYVMFTEELRMMTVETGYIQLGACCTWLTRLQGTVQHGNKRTKSDSTQARTEDLLCVRQMR